MRALARREHSTAELDRRLERAGFAETPRRAVVSMLVRAGYVDDAKFAERRTEQLAERGLGNEAIRFDLEERGIAPELAEAAIAELGPEEERAQRLAMRHADGPAAVRALARRGFSEETVELVARNRCAELG